MTRVAVFAVPMRVRFRGITVREGMLLRGEAGWGEFSPFLEYDDKEAAPWLRAAREAADVGWPVPLRTSIPVNVTVPAVGPEQAAAVVASSSGCRTAKVKVAEPGQSLAQEQARLEAVRDAEVVGVPDAEWGRLVVAVLVGDVELVELRDWVAAVHPRAWAPRHVVRVEDLPLLPTGKVDRLAVQELATSAGLDRDHDSGRA